MLTIHVLPRRLKEFLLTHPLYKSPPARPSHLTDGSSITNRRTSDSNANPRNDPDPQPPSDVPASHLSNQCPCLTSSPFIMPLFYQIAAPRDCINLSISFDPSDTNWGCGVLAARPATVALNAPHCALPRQSCNSFHIPARN